MKASAAAGPFLSASFPSAAFPEWSEMSDRRDFIRFSEELSSLSGSFCDAFSAALEATESKMLLAILRTSRATPSEDVSRVIRRFREWSGSTETRMVVSSPCRSKFSELAICATVCLINSTASFLRSKKSSSSNPFARRSSAVMVQLIVLSLILFIIMQNPSGSRLTQDSRIMCFRGTAPISIVLSYNFSGNMKSSACMKRNHTGAYVA